MRPRLNVSWSEPEPWTAVLVLLLIVIIAGRQPLARAIGTAASADAPAAVAVAPSPAAAAATLGALAAVPQRLRPLPTHAPVDPFRPLVSSTGELRAPAALPQPSSHRASGQPASHRASHHPAGPAGAVTGCASSYLVRAGDSLWTIASGHGLGSWVALYDANRAAIGSDPGLLLAGTRLCLTSR